MYLQATRPGTALAVNPLVAQALQAAQWSANNGYGTATVPGMVGAGHAAPAPPAQPYGGVLAPPAPPLPSVAGALDNSSTGSTSAQYDTFGLAPVVVRFPPNFDTNGGSYVFQAKSGYFLEPITEFYYDPKHKRYFCARDGNYYTYDATCDPPFRVFHPPAPTTDPTTTSGVHGGLNAPTLTAAVTNGGHTDTTMGASAKAATGAGKVKLTTTTAKVGAGVGFGLGGNKKAKLDIAKWGALQHDDDEEEEQQEDPRKKNRKVGGSGGGDGSSVAVSAPSVEVRAPANGDQHTQPPSVASSGSSEAKSAPIVPAPPTAPTTAAPVIPASPRPLSAAAPMPTTVPAAASTATPAAPAGLPICMLCQRQFPSMEMLQRHERESKLHADNLRKLQGGGAAR